MRSLKRTPHTGARRDAEPGGGLNSKTPRLLNSAVRRARFGCRTAHHPSCSTRIENTRPTLLSAPPQAQDRLSAGSPRYLGHAPSDHAPSDHAPISERRLSLKPRPPLSRLGPRPVLWRPRLVPRSPAPKGTGPAYEPLGTGRGVRAYSSRGPHQVCRSVGAAPPLSSRSPAPLSRRRPAGHAAQLPVRGERVALSAAAGGGYSPAPHAACGGRSACAAVLRARGPGAAVHAAVQPPGREAQG